MSPKSILLGFLVWLTLMPSYSSAQTVEAVSRLTADTMLIGEQVVYELNLKIPADFSFEWPSWGDTLVANIEIVNIGEPVQNSPDSENNLWIRQDIIITSFDTGFYYLPGVELRFSPPTDSIFFVAQTNPLMLQVNSVDIDPEAAFRPIKGLLDAPIGFWEIFPWIVGLLALALIIFVIVWLLVRRGKKQIPVPIISKPKVPPHIIALNQLEDLRRQKLWQAGKVKDYHSALSDIIRVYIEDCFNINAVEMTTEEILDSVELLGVNEQAFTKLARALQLGDLVKFAKAEPSGIENDMCLNHMVDFVNESHGHLLDNKAGNKELTQEQAVVKQNQVDNTN